MVCISANFSRPPRRAFTLVEMIAVVAILAVLATFMIPRLGGNQRREFRLAVDQVADLLTMYAQRQGLAQKVVGLRFDPYRHMFELMVLDTDGDPTNHEAYWQIDPYVSAVNLPAFMRDTDVAIIVDGDYVDTSDYPLSSEIGQERPFIEITLRGGGEAATLTLSPYSVAPMISSSFGNSGIVRAGYDLDASGRSREDW